MILIMLAVIMGDQLSKWWILKTFAIQESVVVIPGSFNITFVMNTGAAFGLFAGDLSIGRRFFFAAIALAALTILFFAYRALKSKGRIYTLAIGLIAGGAVGNNLIDRMRFGAVIDFLDFYIGSHHWPAFNVADSAITIGAGLFALGHFFSSRLPGRKGNGR